MSQVFRQLKSSDYAEYYKLINEFRPTHFTEEQFTKILDSVQTSSSIWVLEEDCFLLATGTILYEQKFIHDMAIYAHLEDICVTKTRRGQGLGKKFVTQLLQQVKHCYKVTLDCSDDNIMFYTSCGLEKNGNQMSQITSKLP